VLDWSARYGFENGMEIFGRVENLLNADYQEIIDYNSMGRGLYAGLRYQF
jgi:vitamin B12 transporter